MARQLIASMLGLALAAAATVAGAQGKIAIGYQLPLTGDNSQYGTMFKNSAQMALEEFNKSGKLKGATVEIKFEDSKSDAKEGVNIAKKFSDDASIVGVIGDFNSTVSMAAGQVYAQQKVPQLSQTASHPDFLKISDWQFRNITTMAIESPFIAKWLADAKLKKYAVVAIQNDWGQTAVQNFTDAVKKNGNEIVDTEFFNPGNRDFRSILTKISRNKPDAIVLFMFYEESSSLLQQRLQMNIKTPIYSASPSYEPKLLQLAGPAANGVLLPTTFVADNPDPKVKSFVDGYKSRYNADPSMFAAQAYDATNIMLNAIVAAGPNPTRQKVRDALAATRNFAGVTGDTTFDPKTREPSKTLTRMEIVDGKFKVLR
jgi:branched-chain amino acid transport system substrate-binding protein